jgi:hypothetical protein
MMLIKGIMGYDDKPFESHVKQLFKTLKSTTGNKFDFEVKYIFIYLIIQRYELVRTVINLVHV